MPVRSTRVSTAVAAISMALLAVSLGSAPAATPSHPYYRILLGDGDWVLNYDGSDPLTRHGADWPIDLLFYNQASVSRVKNVLNGPYQYPGSREHLALRDNPQDWTYDQDGGEKTDLPACFNTGNHYRVYADATSDYGFNTELGFYVVASTHMDIKEPCGGDQFGYSEKVERDISNILQPKTCCSVAPNYAAGWHNGEPFRREGNHIWKSNGKVTDVYMF